MHTVYLGIGSNLGDRQGNILQALQRLRRRSSIEAVSSFYETPPLGGAQGPPFLNVAVRTRTELEPRALERFLRDVERSVGRQRTVALSSRPIDIDILLIDDRSEDFGRFEVPHPYLSSRPYNLVPLGEIAPNLRDPRSGRTIAELAAAMPRSDIVKKERSLHFVANRQDEEPEIRLSVNRAGVAKLRRMVRLLVDGEERGLTGEFSMVADLAPDRAGVHMSRFAEILEEAALEVLHDEGPAPIDDLVARIARDIVRSQKALCADVRLVADFGLERWTPVSGKRGEETYRLIGVAHAEGASVRSAVGVEAEGMTACPCAQLMMREHSIRDLEAAGFLPDEAARALDALPVATHNQRGRGSVLIGALPSDTAAIRAEDLVEIVENSMSSETYDLLKRPDEFFIVNKAHQNPKFVEDVVRGIVARTLDVYADLSDAAFVAAAHVNYESIHKHDALAEAFGTFGELRAELRTGRYGGRRTDLAAWLGTTPSAVTA